MKILIFNYEYPPIGGGAANATFYLLKEYSKKKDVIVDLITSSSSAFHIEKVSRNITIHFLDINKKGSDHIQTFPQLLRYTFNALRYSKKLIKNKSFDLVHAIFGIPCGYIAMKLNLPYIVSLRGSDVPSYNVKYKILDLLIFNWLSPIIWKRSNSVIALSSYLRDMSRKLYTDKWIKVIYNGIDIRRFQPDEKQRDSKYFDILYVGRLHPTKGIIYLLKAFKLFSKTYQKAYLHIIGDGCLRKKIRSFIHSNRLNNRVILYGKLSQDEIIRYYKKSDVFVMPSIHEALSNSVLEAKACGLPVITTKTGACELFDNEELFIDCKSETAIYEKLHLLIENVDIRTRIGNKNRKDVLDMSWEKCSNNYINLYTEIIE